MFLLIFFFATLAACKNYTDYLARTVSLTLCDGAYSYNPPKYLRKKLRASEVQTFSTNIDGGTSSGLIVTLPEHNIIALTFRAELSEPFDFENWRRFFFPMRKWLHEGAVSKFVGDGFKKLWRGTEMKRVERMKVQFRNTMEELPNSTVLVTGHYVGGGLAALVAHDIVKEGLAKKEDVILITLGQIMVGDKDFAKAYEREVVNSFRVVTKGDLIPHVPGKRYGYAYNGKEVYYKSFGMTLTGRTGYRICFHAMCSRTHFRPIGSGAYASVTRFGLLQFGVLA
ncbi:hypothetical protein Aduo_010112 [Ancylostoma duodenale]